jgi:glycosyl transferase family 25
MLRPSVMARKLRTAIQNPTLVRNYVYGRLNYFPVGKLTNPYLIDLPTYCISLVAAARRRSLMDRQVRKAGLQRFRFVDAVDASAWSIEQFAAQGDYDEASAIRYHGHGLGIGEIAVALSHGLAYEAIVREQHPLALVLEDDALFVSRALNRIDFSDVPPDFEMLFLSSFVDDNPPIGHVRGPVYTTESWYGSAAAYILTLEGARKLAEVYRPVKHASDGLLGRCMEAPAGEEHPFRQKGGGTTLVSYMIRPDPVLNGSTHHHTRSLLPTP